MLISLTAPSSIFFTRLIQHHTLTWYVYCQSSLCGPAPYKTESISVYMNIYVHHFYSVSYQSLPFQTEPIQTKHLLVIVWFPFSPEDLVILPILFSIIIFLSFSIAQFSGIVDVDLALRKFQFDLMTSLPVQDITDFRFFRGASVAFLQNCSR